jgi:L-methionine (R)-S-oxide reductase
VHASNLTPRALQQSRCVSAVLASGMLDERCQAWLSVLLARHGAVAGTVHVVRGDVLAIVAAVNIPPKVQEVTASIAMGKGMAGLAWQSDRAIQTCNLKDDTSGAVKPGAKAVDARAAVALPVHDGAGSVRAVVGLAWMDERVLSDDVIAAIARDAEDTPVA